MAPLQFGLSIRFAEDSSSNVLARAFACNVREVQRMYPDGYKMSPTQDGTTLLLGETLWAHEAMNQLADQVVNSRPAMFHNPLQGMEFNRLKSFWGIKKRQLMARTLRQSAAQLVESPQITVPKFQAFA